MGLEKRDDPYAIANGINAGMLNIGKNRILSCIIY